MITLLKPGELQIVHATPGRLRIRGDYQILENLRQQLQAYEPVEKVTLKKTTGSLVVYFDSTRLPLAQISQFLAQSNLATPDLAAELAPQPEQNLPKIGAEILELLLPLTAGWLVIRTLSLTGWRSLLIYLIVAEVTREVIVQFLPQLNLQQEPEPREFEIRNSEFGIGEVLTTESGLQTPRCLSKTKGFEFRRTHVEPEILSDIEIIHSLPGRVRLRLPQIKDNPNYASKVEYLLQSMSEVTGVRLKPQAASVVVFYQPGAMSDVEMRSRLLQSIEGMD